jgi:glutamate-5-semialdehyde dehydrogenase
MTIQEKAERAKAASLQMATLSTRQKNEALLRIKHTLNEEKNAVFEANEKDLAAAEKNHVPAPLVGRLEFDGAKLTSACEGIDALVKLEDPTGKILSARELDSGLNLYQVSCPIGVIGVIFESRPDALVQISTLCLKSGNTVLLKGGTEALETNRILFELIEKASTEDSDESGLPDGWINLAETRSDVKEMLSLERHVDLLVPRGSNEFVRYIMDNTNIPVLGHADGICHAYVHEDADLDMAARIVVDSKTQYVAVCNALETLLVHKNAVESFLPVVKQKLEEKGVRLRGCEKTRSYIEVQAANDKDWETEYLDLILSVKVVADFEEAVSHINTHGSHHTDVIITGSGSVARDFMMKVDSANVFWNCSTRFSDGFRYGLGAEVGISTSKIHARGPVGLDGLVIYKWQLLGSGQIVADYVDTGRSFTHKPINHA